MNNDQKESFFIMERNQESIDPNEDVTVSPKFEKSANIKLYCNIGPSKAKIDALIYFSSNEAARIEEKLQKNLDFRFRGNIKTTTRNVLIALFFHF